MARILQATFLAVLVCIKSANTNVCTNVGDPCLCQLSEYKQIDLKDVTQNAKGDGKFLEEWDSSGTRYFSYFFHGCTDGVLNWTAHHTNSSEKFPTGSLIVVSSVYNTTFNGTSSKLELLANSTEISFDLVQGNVDKYQLVYHQGEKVVANIYLMCNDFKTPFIKLLSRDNTSISLALSSPSVCVQTHNSGMSTGSVLLILLCISFGIYFVGGCAVLYFIRGARGLEMIPNIDFWRSLPGLVKDGLIFLFSGCNTTAISTPETYDRI